MLTDSTYKKALAVFLTVSAAVMGAAILDEIAFHRMDDDVAAAIEQRFKARSTKIGAWVMDRAMVTEMVGIPIESLPSYQWAEQHKREAE